MPFCTKCGMNLQPTSKFCTRCGTPVMPAGPAPGAGYTPLPKVTYYVGQQVTLPFLGGSFVVSAPMDAFNYYRREFRKLARIQMENLRREYFAMVRDLDTFLLNFPVMYSHFRQPLIDAACDILVQAGIYDVSVQQFSDDHKNDFCLCGEDMDIMIDSFNKTIEANQERKARGYNMMPSLIFRGLGGIALAFATNVAINAIAEADIRNANVTPKQRQELFARIDPNMLLHRAYLDYWRVFLTLTWLMQQRGVPMWYPTEDSNQRSNGIYQNLIGGRIPAEKVPEMAAALLQIHPFHDDHLALVERQFGCTDQTAALFAYFGKE